MMKGIYRRWKHWSHLLRVLLMVPILSLFIYLAYSRPDINLFIALVSSFPGFLLLFLSILPSGGVRFGDARLKKPFWQWMGGFLLVQLLIGWMLLSHSLAFIGLGPDFVKGTLTLKQAWLVSQDYFLNEWGIFPWGIYLMWGISLAFFTYHQGGVPFHHRHAAVFWHGFLGSVAKLMTEAIVVSATALLLMLSIGSSLILLYQSVRLYFGWSDYFQTLLPTVFVYSFFFVLTWVVFNRKNIRHWTRQGITLSGFMSIASLVGILALISSSFFGDWFKSLIPFPLPFQTCNCVERYEAAGPDLRFAVTEWAWFLLWSPLVGSAIARLSVGRTLRAVVIGFLSIPILVGLILIIFLPSFELPTFNLPLVYFIVGFLSFLICFLLLKGHINNQLFTSGFMPIPSETKMGVLSLKEGTKIHGISYFSKRFLLGPLTILFLHTMGGWLLIQFPIVILGPLIIFKAFPCMSGALIYQLFKERIFCGSKTREHR